ncbi:MAG: GxxExxY protein [Polyangiaceae bacterium]|nr:GxxExxY protein [Polyangiaceae bacterium]
MLVEEELSGHIVGAAIDVHWALGPGLQESAYEECLCHELELRGLPFGRQVKLPVTCKGVELGCGYLSAPLRERAAPGARRVRDASRLSVCGYHIANVGKWRRCSRVRQPGPRTAATQAHCTSAHGAP